MRARALLLVVTGLATLAGCPITRTPGDGSSDTGVPTNLDGAWRITSETGLVNQCITILGDRVTQVSDCENGRITFISDSEPSARSGSQIIWTFRTNEAGAEILHTISVFRQSDGTLRGRYSLRAPDSEDALTDGVIMETRRVRI